jgi:signal peptidase II
VVALDQLTKLWIRVNLSQADQIELLPGFLDLVFATNEGGIFGLLSSQTGLLIGLGIAGSLIILVFLHYFPPATTLGTLSFALILGGQVGNLIDRIHFGYVTDFIRIHLHKLFSWPAFNVADAAITVGIFALIYYFHQSGVFTKAYEQNHKPKN